MSKNTVFGPFGGEKFAFTGTFFQGMHSSIYNSTFWQKKIFDPDPIAGQFAQRNEELETEVHNLKQQLAAANLQGLWASGLQNRLKPCIENS